MSPLSTSSRPKVSEREVQLPHPALPVADWADAWETTVARNYTNARAAAEAIVSAFPWWSWPLLALRRILVVPFGLKNSQSGVADHVGDRIGFFPVVYSAEHQLVAGLDDRHLDFRIIVDMKDAERAQAIRLTTLIARHNIGGRIYLAAVLPFHRAIIRSALSRLALAQA